MRVFVKMEEREPAGGRKEGVEGEEWPP